MIPEFDTVLIIPCYNEEKRLDIQAFQDFLLAHPDFFILFVDDGSRDNTATLLQSIPPGNQFAALSLPSNVGKGDAVRQGVLHALENFQCRYIGFADADLSTPLSEFVAFQHIANLHSSTRIVMGSRVQMLGKNIKRSLVRHWFSRIVATAICKVIDEPVYDTQCGAKLFERATAARLFADPFFSKWLFDVEILARHKRSEGSEGFRATIIEQPVAQWIEKPNSKIRYHHIFRILRDLFRIRNHYFRSK